MRRTLSSIRGGPTAERLHFGSERWHCVTVPRHRTSRTTTRILSLTLEERLHRAHQRFALLADVFELRATASISIETDSAVSSAAANALADICREAAEEIRSLLDCLPAEIGNWSECGVRRSWRRR
jgi:hypothetical protein